MFTKVRRAVLIGAIWVLVWLLRISQVESPLPGEWVTGQRISITITVLQSPEYQDDYTLIRAGLWKIKLKGYQRVIPGNRLKISGDVKVDTKMGKVTSILLTADNLEIIGDDKKCLYCLAIIELDKLRQGWVRTLSRILPEPMASLSAGILLGVRSQMPQDFYTSLQKTGTMHIVAASGYNVTIVSVIIMKLAMVWLSKGLAILGGVAGVVIYIIIAGGSSSVVRAGIMGSLTLMSYYLGRPAEAKRLLWAAAGIMLLVNPLTVFDIGFQLSVSATLGLLYIEKSIRIVGERVTKWMGMGVQGYLAEYLYPTLAASASTLPIILWHFGRTSWISPLVNMLILPVVPLIMLLSALTIVSSWLNEVILNLMGWITYVPLAWMVGVIRFFGKI